MTWSPDSCLSCDKTCNGYVFCSEACRVADFEKGYDYPSATTTSMLSLLLSRSPNSCLDIQSTTCSYHNHNSYQQPTPDSQIQPQIHTSFVPSSPKPVFKPQSIYSEDGSREAKQTLRSLLDGKESKAREISNPLSTYVRNPISNPWRSSQASLDAKEILMKYNNTSLIDTISPIVASPRKSHKSQATSPTVDPGQQLQRSQIPNIVSPQPRKSLLTQALQLSSNHTQEPAPKLPATTAAISFPSLPHHDISLLSSSAASSLYPSTSIRPTDWEHEWEHEWENSRDDVGGNEMLHSECGLICQVADGSLCLGGDYWR